MELHRRLGHAEPTGDVLVRELLADGFEHPLLRAREGVAGGEAEPGDALDPLGEDGARRPERPLADAADRVPAARSARRECGRIPFTPAIRQGNVVRAFTSRTKATTFASG